MHQEALTQILDRLPYDSHYEALHKLREILPPPLEETPEAYARRDRAVLNQIKQLVPVSAIEVELAAKSVACAEYGEGCLREARKLPASYREQRDRLIAQACRMGREARGYLATLERVQKTRFRREATEAGARQADAVEAYAADLMLDALADPPGRANQPPPMQVAPPPDPVAAHEPVAAPEPDAIAQPAETPSLQPKQAPEAEAAPNTAASSHPTPPPRSFAAPAPARRSRSKHDDDDWPQPDWAEEAERYAIVYPQRARLIRQLGGLPKNCDFGPPEPALLRAILHGTTPELLALDQKETTLA